MDSDDKPVVEFAVTDIDYVGVSQGEQATLNVIFDCSGAHHVALKMSPKIVSLLETRLSQVRDELASRRSLQ